MRVAFFVSDPEKRIAGWEATIGKRRKVPGTLMGGAAPDRPPHDLVQYIVEAATAYENGFWGLLAKGATFRTTGRKRTKPGRAFIAEHRAELRDSERLANEHVAAWRAGTPTPVTKALDETARQWATMTVGDRLVFQWPSARGVIEPERVTT